MMSLLMTADDYLHWHVPHGDGQTLRVWRATADRPTVARIASRSGVVDPLQSDSARLVFIGEAASHVLVIERIDGGRRSDHVIEGDLPAGSRQRPPVDFDDDAVFYHRFCAQSRDAPSCLVAVRQPLRRPATHAARSWVDSVIDALESEGGAPDGLISANFFVARDAQVVLNLTEWSSAAAHRAALKPADFAEHGSIGHSETWRAAREHPAITRAHDVARYRFIGPSDGRDQGVY